MGESCDEVMGSCDEVMGESCDEVMGVLCLWSDVSEEAGGLTC